MSGALLPLHTVRLPILTYQLPSNFSSHPLIFVTTLHPGRLWTLARSFEALKQNPDALTMLYNLLVKAEDTNFLSWVAVTRPNAPLLVALQHLGRSFDSLDAVVAMMDKPDDLLH